MIRNVVDKRAVGGLGRLARSFVAVLSALSVVAATGADVARADSTKNSGRTTVSSSAGLTYTVRAGDGLSIIASRVKVSMADLMAVNGFQRTTVILPGQVIKLPDHAVPVASSGSVSSGSASAGNAAATSSSVSSSAGLTYTVRAGDGLSIIASRVKVSMADLMAVNGFKRTTVILPGQVIKLPDHATVVASPGVGTANPSSTTVAPTGATGAAAAVAFARAQVGKPYRFNTAGPETYDCSGLTMAAYATAGVSLPHQSLAQSKRGTAVDWRTEKIRPGDLVFTFSSRNQNEISHVGIAINATQWVEAPFTGGNVRISNLPSNDRIQAVRRMVDA